MIKIYKKTVLPVVLYECDTCSVTLREEFRLKVFENWVLGKIFVPKRERISGGWIRLPNEELHSLCFTEYY
jgi:hypothetical protein